MCTNNPTKLEDFKLHQRFEFTINKLARLMQDRLQSGLEKQGVTRVQWIALTSISIENKRSPSDLAEHIGVSRPAVSRMLRQMESLDLIERSVIGADGRTRQLNLTDKGHLSMNLCWPHARETDQYFLSKVSESQREALCSMLSTFMPTETQILDKK